MRLAKRQQNGNKTEISPTSSQAAKEDSVELIEQATAGARIRITKHRRPVASLSAADMEHVHIGARFGRGALKPLLRAPTQGKYLEVLENSGSTSDKR